MYSFVIRLSHLTIGHAPLKKGAPFLLLFDIYISNSSALAYISLFPVTCSA